MNIFIENLSFKVFFYILLKKNVNKVFILDNNFVGKFLTQFLCYSKNITISFFAKYKLMEIVDENGELIRFRFDRINLFDAQKEIENSTAFKKQFSINNNDLLNKFIIRNSIGSGLIYQHSVIRALYLVEVVHYFRKKI